MDVLANVESYVGAGWTERGALSRSRGLDQTDAFGAASFLVRGSPRRSRGARLKNSDINEVGGWTEGNLEFT